MESIAGMVVGFALTTLVSGWWAARLQERSWNWRDDVGLREAEHERSSGACQELMGLLTPAALAMIVDQLAPGQNPAAAS